MDKAVNRTNMRMYEMKRERGRTGASYLVKNEARAQGWIGVSQPSVELARFVLWLC